MTTPFLNASIGYYEAADDIAIDPQDLAVSQRPSPMHHWSGAAWSLPPPEIQMQQLLGLYRAAVQEYLDAQARAIGYDSIFTACTYADEPAVPQFQADGRLLRAWRSIVWGACYLILSDAKSGLRAAPSIEQLLSELPELHP